MKKIFPLALLSVAAHAGASPRFDDNAVIDVDLTGPIGSLIKNKKERNELPFVLKANGVEYHIQVRIRGKSQSRVGEFPPLRFNFSGRDTLQSALGLIKSHKRGNSGRVERHTWIAGARPGKEYRLSRSILYPSRR